MPKARITLTMSPEVWRRTKDLAQMRGTSASALVEQALAAAISRADTDAAMRAVSAIAAMQLPTGTPEEIEREIMEGRFG